MSTPLAFSAEWYLQQNPDIAAAIEAGASFNAAEHFALYGRAEGRSASPLFDSQQYLANNPDVAEAVAQGLITAWDHFEQFGGAEGRTPTPLFDETFYLQQNPDVAAAIEQGLLSSAAQHFVLFGQSEPRAINPVIHLGKYLSANPDVAAAAANGVVNPFTHLVQNGVTEGRPLGNGVALADFSNDPGFTQALSGGNPTAALGRVGEVAPFIPTFERPAGWSPPANTPIPVDFVPPSGSGISLVIPPEVVVPPTMTLPPVFEPVKPPPTPTPTPTPTPPGGSDGDSGGNAPTLAPIVTYSTAKVSEAVANDGSITEKLTITLTNDTFTGNNDEVLAGAVVTNVPAGLTAVVTKKSATTAELSFTGTATNHANAQDLANLTVTLGNAAFTSGDASKVTGATKSDIVMDFADPAITFTVTIDVGGDAYINASEATSNAPLTATVTSSTLLSVSVSGTSAADNQPLEVMAIENPVTGKYEFDATLFKEGTLLVVATDIYGQLKSTSLILDTTAPALSSSTPTANATAVSPGSNIVLNFGEAVAAGTGNIVLSNGTDTRMLDVTDTTQVQISGDIVTINPTADLLPGTSYNVQMASGVLMDMAGNAHAGISNATTLAFTTNVNPALILAPLPASFGTKVDYATVSGAYSISSADVNGDGQPDLLVANSDVHTVSVLTNKNDGSGTFNPKVDYAAGTGPISVSSADVNGDGQPDLLVANLNSNDVSVLTNKGSGNFNAIVNYPTGTQPRSVSSADVNGDGKPDLLVANSGFDDNTVSVLTNKGDGTFNVKVDNPTGSSPTSVSSADVNGDSKPDLLVANSGDSTVSVLTGKGDGTFNGKIDYSAPVIPFSISSADVNGDGKPDLLVTDIGVNDVLVLTNKGDGTFNDARAYDVGLGPQSISSADVNGDGQPDLLVSNNRSHTVSVLTNKNDGSGTFNARVDYPTGLSPTSAISADVNGDGKSDLLVANSSGTVSVLLNTSPGGFTEQTPVVLNSTLTLNDADGDADWNGGTLKVQITANASTDDRLGLPTTNPGGSGIWLDGTTIKDGATAIGTTSATAVSGGTAWTFTFNASATNALVQSVGRAFTFDNQSDTPSSATRTITFTATDKGGLSATASMTLGVTAINDTPTLSGVPGTEQAVTAGTPATLDDFTVADVDSTSLTVTLTATNGTLGNLTDDNGTVPGIQLTGTATAINTAIAGATFTATNPGAASIGISVSDGAATATATYNLTAAPETTPPTASAFTATATTVGATSNETGTLGLYAGASLLAKTGGGTLSTALAANTAATIAVEAQGSVTSATLKVSDAAGNFATTTQNVVLGTNDIDNALNGSASADFMYGFGGADYLRGGDGADVISGGAGNDLLVGQTGADTLLGGEGNDFLDALWDGANEMVTDVLVGGPDNDSLMLNDASDLFVEESDEGTLDSLILGIADIRAISVNGVVGGPLNGANGKGFEQLTLTNGIQARLVGAQLDALTLNVNHVNNQSGGTLAVDATINDTTDLSRLTFNAGTYTDSARNQATGSPFTGTIAIQGSSGSETIIGTSRSDTITGGAAADSLTGGAGADTFVFTDNTTADTITDFTVGDGDVLSFDISSLGLNAADFFVGAVTIVNAAGANGLAPGAASNHVVMDIASSIAQTINLESEWSGAAIAIETDTGRVLYDANANFYMDAVVIGTINPAQAALIVAGNLSFIA